MTEKKIVQALRCCKFGVPCEKCPVVGNKDCFEEVNTAAAELIERLTAENAALREKVPQWISVEEQRPEPGKRVLATDGVFVGEACRWKSGEWRRYDDCLCWFVLTGHEVTHWMPLPEAPEEGEKHE